MHVHGTCHFWSLITDNLTPGTTSTKIHMNIDVISRLTEYVASPTAKVCSAHSVLVVAIATGGDYRYGWWLSL